MRSKIGKFLGIKRIELDETLVEMAEKLDISISYLSAIENGKREIPDNFQEKLIRNYIFTEKERKELEKAINLSKKESKIDFTNLSDDRKELSLRYARQIYTMSDEKINKIWEILRGDD